MASTRNFFDVLPSEEPDDPETVIARIVVPKQVLPTSAAPTSAKKPAAKLPSKPAEPVKEVQKPQGEKGGGRGSRRGGGRGFGSEPPNGASYDKIPGEGLEQENDGFQRGTGYGYGSGRGRGNQSYGSGPANDLELKRGRGAGRSRGRGRGYYNDSDSTFQGHGGPQGKYSTEDGQKQDFGDATEGPRKRDSDLSYSAADDRRGYGSFGYGRGTRGNMEYPTTGEGKNQEETWDVSNADGNPAVEEEKIDIAPKEEAPVAAPAAESAIKDGKDEVNEMTLEEYERMQAEKRKNLPAPTPQLRQAKVDKDFESMQLMDRKADEDAYVKLGFEKEKSKKKEAAEKEDKSKKLSIEFQLKPAEGVRRRDLGAGRGRGRGRGRDSFNSFTNTAPSKVVPLEFTPAIEDPGEFPTLGGR